VPYTCTQCDDAWCVNACPVEAIKIDNGLGAKIVHDSTCVGCKVCTIACPFGTINYVARNRQGAEVRSVRRRPGLREGVARPGAITYIDADWTGFDKMRQWAGPRQHRARSLRRHYCQWAKKVLRVNLTKGTCTAEPLNMAWANDYLGQRGLATKYLVSEIDPKVDPLSPETR